MGKYEDDELKKRVKGEIKEEIKDKVEDLIRKNSRLKKYQKSQAVISTICILGTIIYCFLINKSFSLNALWARYEFYLCLILVLMYNYIIEERAKQLKLEIEGGKKSIKDKMILRICDCKDDCYCKEKLNKYMKKNGVGII